jgi:hypothetical protein
MNPRYSLKLHKILKSFMIIAYIGVCLSIFFSADVFGATAKEINASVNAERKKRRLYRRRSVR